MTLALLRLGSVPTLQSLPAPAVRTAERLQPDPSYATPHARHPLARAERSSQPLLRWLGATDLARSDVVCLRRAPAVIWRVVLVHRPPFSRRCHGREPLHRLPELDRYGVDLVLSGHDHDYERSWPTR